MTRIEIEAKVKGILNEQLAVDNDMIQTTSKLTEDLGADSLDVIEIVMACEEEFEVEVDDELDNQKFDAKDLTFDDLVGVIEKLAA